ncbi:hypothetical protein BIFDEN_01915 [Bifidobacterium dentium ATCC 27678]|nr:hypothetical protein BIFDEN_01915 [Bifidobacterium dentium ATCC 27678]
MSPSVSCAWLPSHQGGGNQAQRRWTIRKAHYPRQSRLTMVLFI